MDIRYYTDDLGSLFKIADREAYLWSEVKGKWIIWRDALEAPFDITHYEKLTATKAAEKALEIGADL